MMDLIREYPFGLQLLGKSIFQIQVLLWWRHHLHRFQVHLDLFLKVATKLSIVGAVLYSIDFWYTEKSDPLVWWQWHMRTRHYRLLCDNRDLILIEPYLLNVSLVRSASIQNKTAQQIGKEQDDLRWRFNLTDGLFRWDNQSLTVAMFADQFKQQKLDLGRFEKSFSVFGPAGPYDESNTSSVLHVFYEWKQSLWERLLEGLLSIPPVQLHLVVMYKVDHFVWIGQIVSNLSRSHHFGLYQQIYDPFEGSSHDGVSLPADVQHFLSQMSTDRYVHCPTERTTKWFEGNNLTIDSTKTRASESAIVAMKGLMRTMQMHFWIASGTLLGWFRQCHITPYDTDTDFGTWIKYGYTTNLTTKLMNNVPAHNLTLYHRFGDATSQTLEYSFLSEFAEEKVDLFFVVPNGTHFRMALHFLPYYTYLVYPQYELCSVALLGHKLLAPCTPEQVVQTEYGLNWSKPVSDWNYVKSSANTEPAILWKFNSSQMEFF